MWGQKHNQSTGQPQVGASPGLHCAFFVLCAGSGLATNVCRKITGQLTSAIAQQEDVAVQLEALDILSDMLSRCGRPPWAWRKGEWVGGAGRDPHSQSQQFLCPRPCVQGSLIVPAVSWEHSFVTILWTLRSDVNCWKS